MVLCEVRRVRLLWAGGVCSYTSLPIVAWSFALSFQSAGGDSFVVFSSVSRMVHLEAEMASHLTIKVRS